MRMRKLFPPCTQPLTPRRKSPRQDDPLGKVPDIISSRLAEGGCGDEDAFGGTETNEAFDESVSIRAASGYLVRIA